MADNSAVFRRTDYSTSLHSVMRMRLLYGQPISTVPSTGFVRRFGLRHRLGGHSGCVNAASWSDDGTLVVTSGDDRRLVVHSALTGAALQTTNTNHTRNVFDAKMLTRSLVVTCGADGRVIANDLQTSSQTCILTAGAFNPIHRLAKLDNQMEFCCGGGSNAVATIFDLRVSPSVAIKIGVDLIDDATVYGIAACPSDKSYVAVAGDFGTIPIFDVRLAEKPVVMLHMKHPKHVLRNVTNRPQQYITEMRKSSRRNATNLERSEIWQNLPATGLDWSKDGRSLVVAIQPGMLYSCSLARGLEVEDSSSASSVSVEPQLANTITDRKSRRRSGVPHLSALSSTALSTGTSNSANPIVIESEMNYKRSPPSIEASGQQQYVGFKHLATIKGVTFFGLHDEFIAMGDDNGFVRLYDRYTTTCIGLLKGHSNVNSRRYADFCAVNTISPHPSRLSLLTCGVLPIAKLWDTCRDAQPLTLKVIERTCNRTWTSIRSLLSRVRASGQYYHSEDDQDEHEDNVEVHENDEDDEYDNDIDPAELDDPIADSDSEVDFWSTDEDDEEDEDGNDEDGEEETDDEEEEEDDDSDESI